MTLSYNFTLPLQNPVLIFALVMLIILLSPLILRRFRIPSIIGLIIAGVIIGPNGLNLLLRDSSIILFGTVGLLYIMFLAGLEIDMVQFKRSRYKSILFGLLTFTIPQIFGTLIGYYYLGFSLLSSILLASMFASHTLLTYPIVSRLGINKIEAVTVAIGGTLITDTLALFLLSVIVQVNNDQMTPIFWVSVIILSIIFGFLLFWGVPRLARWYFRTFAGEGYSHFLFVMAIVFLSAFLAQMAYLEAIIGAFLAGIALNRSIPSNSTLMNRIEFVGNTLFIPFFLIATGMIVDLRVFVKDAEAIKVALVMTGFAITAKWIAAFITQKLLRYSSDERNIIFGLSNSQAAATLAAVTIGYNLGLLDDNVLNGSIMMILVTCLISSFATESAGRKIALSSIAQPTEHSNVPERILVPVSNPNTIEKLIDLAILIKDPKSTEPIYPLTVIKDTQSAAEQIANSKKVLQSTMAQVTAADKELQLVTRIDLNVASGIIRAINELQITTLIVGWNARMTTHEKIFGTILDNILHNIAQTTLVCKILYPLNTCRRIRLFVPPLAHHETGFLRWLRLIHVLSTQTGTNLEIISVGETLKHIERSIFFLKLTLKVSYIEDSDPPDFKQIASRLSGSDLYIFVSSRRATISYLSYLDEIPYQLSKYFEPASFIIIYPGQQIGSGFESTLQIDDESMFPYEKNISRLRRLSGFILNLFIRRQ